MSEYIITGLTKDNNRCLARLLGKCTKEQAKERLKEFINDTTGKYDMDKRGLTDFEIKVVEEKECWWRGGLD